MDYQNRKFVTHITREASDIGLDAQGWSPSTEEDLGGEDGGWMEELGPITPKHDAMISYGLGEETLAIIEGVNSKGETHYMVGVGEALRPYRPLYSGSSTSAAVHAFHNEAHKMIDTIKERILEEGGDV